ncbi:MAG: hypothetical protein V4609_16510, partial [Pseudomonadota bacterium]
TYDRRRTASASYATAVTAEGVLGGGPIETISITTIADPGGGAPGTVTLIVVADEVPDGLTVEATEVALAWDWRSLLQRRVLLSRLHAASVLVTDERLPPAEPATPPAPPQQLRLPLPVEVQEVRIGRLAYRGALAIEASEIAARYAYEGAEHALDLRSLVLPQGRVSGQARLGAQAPLPLQLRLQGE